MKMKKDDACSLLKLERVEKLHLLLLQARTDFDDIDIAFRGRAVSTRATSSHVEKYSNQ